MSGEAPVGASYAGPVIAAADGGYYVENLITETPSHDPDVWMCFSAAWPEDPARLRTFFDDLLAELESME